MSAPPLHDGERLQHSAAVTVGTDVGTAHLTSHRVVVTFASNKAAITLPLTHVIGTKTSVVTATNTKVMMMIQYALQAAVAATDAQSKLVLVFTGKNAADERAKWKDIIARAITNRSAQMQTDSAPTDATALSKPPSPSPLPSPSPPSQKVPATVSDPIVGSLELRAALLARDSVVKSLHTDLVVSGIVDETEFWQSRADMLRAESERSRQAVVGISTTFATKSNISLSSLIGTAAPAGTTSSTSAAPSTVRLTLDANTIHQIFVDQPAVYEAYQRLVPDRLTEKMFWTKYLRSKYLHEQRNQIEANGDANTTSAASAAGGDVFDNTIAEETRRRDGANTNDPSEDQRRRTLIRNAHVDPAVDLSSADASDAVTRGQPTIMDRESAASANTSDKAPRSSNAGERANDTMLSRLNLHGRLLLQPQSAARSNGTTAVELDESAAAEEYHKNLSDSMTLQELQATPAPAFNELHLNTQTTATRNATQSGSTLSEVSTGDGLEDRVRAFASTLSQLSAPKLSSHVPTKRAAAVILTDITHTSRGLNRAIQYTQKLVQQRSVMGPANAQANDLDLNANREQTNHSSKAERYIFSQDASRDVLIPTEFEERLRAQFTLSSELLRHFYSALPMTASSAPKIERVKAALDKCANGAAQLRHSLNQSGHSNLTPLLKSMIDRIDQCNTTYQNQKLKANAPHRQHNAAAHANGNGALSSASNSVKTEPIHIMTD